MRANKQAILRKYGVSPHDLLQQGMEAEVYALGSHAVLKLYNGTTSLAYLDTLQNFYAALDTSSLTYSLPYIETAAEEGGFCISIERRLTGKDMSAVLPTLTKAQLEALMHSYLAAALELANIRVPPAFDRYKLFDAEGVSRRADGDWHAFLSRYLGLKLAQVAPYLNRDVEDFAGKVERLYSVLAQPYTGTYHVVHGDFFPGNLLIDQQHRVTALLDFGLFTMYGDPLFDIATGWVFLDMYDELKANVRERYLAIVLETLGERLRGKLYRYVLLYSVYSANAYSATCADGHYRWCVANLNNPEYWNFIA